MRHISEYTDATSAYEIFTHLYGLIVSRKITQVAELKAYVSKVSDEKKRSFAFQSAFRLIREISWGFFRDLNPKDYPILWKALVVPDNQYPAVGELKRSMSITDIYVAFIDIHGYTAFCQKSKGNTQLLRLLDTCIETDVRQICRENHVVSNRARGDEIVMVGTSAYDVTVAAVLITDYFGKRRLTGDTEMVKKRSGESLQLPPLSVSIGIAGGKIYDTMIITAGGDLSGSAVNTAARLQSQANRLSPQSNRILTTQHVQSGFEREAAKQEASAIGDSELAFFDVGPVIFKGVELRLVDAIVDSDQMYRKTYQKHFSQLVDNLRSDSWAEKTFLSLTDLIIAACKRMPRFDIAIDDEDSLLSSLSNDSVSIIVQKAVDRFKKDRLYPEALNELRSIEDFLHKIEGFDALILLYLEKVIEKYELIITAYDRHISAYTEKNRTNLFSLEDNRRYENAKVSASALDVLKAELVGRIQVDKRRMLWTRLVKSMDEALKFTMYLGK